MLAMSRMLDKASLIATVLAGSWRQTQAPLTISRTELDIVTPLLLASGAGALGWKRVANSNHRTSAAALELEQAYRLHALQSAIHERNIQRALILLRSAGVEPILVKGWAVARLYPDTGLRPYGDLDLCIEPKQYHAASSVLEKDLHKSYEVDLHRSFETLDHKSWEELYSRSRLVKLGEVEVRVLCAEDHLRVLCFHFLREGAWRPLWLCDIAVALETRPADFDWDLFTDHRDRRRKWFAGTVVLANLLLGARMDGVPGALTAEPLPSWFVPSVLRAWELRSMSRRHTTPMGAAWRAPARTLKPRSLSSHWPNPIEATIGVNGPFNEMPRLPFQIGNCAVRTIAFLRHLRRSSS
jgi:Uncharacterised nucleotidyltransferase